VRPAPATDELRESFARGRVQPKGVVWFGIRSFWGHLRHFIAAAIATEDIDSRDWMTPDEPEDLAERIAAVLGGTRGTGNVVDSIGRDLWIDFLADTGDDVSVSRAIARLVTALYELPDPDRRGELLVAPRGDILLFGGDTAYPVATAQEIMNRVAVPFNQLLERDVDRRSGVLLGIPGNHDWYDGLDGFGRMFRRRAAEDEEPRPSVIGISRRMLDHYAEWARELVRGGKVDKPQAIALAGYVPVQNASYFVLPLTSTIHLFGIDRQLKDIDSRQCRFHLDWKQRHPRVCPWVLLPDPLYQFGVPSRTGIAMVQSLALDFASQPHFLLSGDVHHYERLQQDGVLHVVAGGGGAFLHPAPMSGARTGADRRWPGAAQSSALLRGVPWRIALGRSGFLPHLTLAALFSLPIAFGIRQYERLGLILSAPLLVTLIVTIVYALLGGVRRNRGRVLPLAFAAGVLTAAIPVLCSFLVTRLLVSLDLRPSAWGMAVLAYAVAVFAGAWIFGAYLALLTRIGVEHTQAFSALDHPGFKHFLRLRVRADGSSIDAWCIGLVDPLEPGEPPVLVDQFSFRPDQTNGQTA
jgi:hypothetical protein